MTHKIKTTLVYMSLHYFLKDELIQTEYASKMSMLFTLSLFAESGRISVGVTTSTMIFTHLLEQKIISFNVFEFLPLAIFTTASLQVSSIFETKVANGVHSVQSWGRERNSRKVDKV